MKEHDTSLSEWQISSIDKLLNCWSWWLWWKIYECDSCWEQKVVCFTCKSKICSKCSAPRANQRNSKLSSQLPNNLSYYHITLTIPDTLWNFFLKFRDDNPFYILFDAAKQTILDFFRIKFKCIPWFVSVLHTFWADIKRNCHIHMICTAWWISFDHSSVIKTTDTYLPYQMINKRRRYNVLSRLRSFFTSKHPQYLTWVNKFIDKLFQKERYVQCSKKLSTIRKTINYISRYFYRPPIWNSRIVWYDWTTIKIKYEHKQPKETRFKSLPVLDFLLSLIQQLPNRYSHGVRYWWIFSPKHKHFFLDLIQLLTWAIPSLPLFTPIWFRALMIHTFQKDPLLCSCCWITLSLKKVSYKPLQTPS